MKVLMTSETYLPRIGGAEVHVHNLFSKLKDDGHDVTLITNEMSPVSDEVIRLTWSGRAIPKIFFIILKKSKNVSLIHCHYSHRLAMLAGIVAKVRRIPIVITLHGMGILDLPNSGLVARLKHGLYRYISLKLATHIISTSDDLALIADRYISRKKLTIVMNGYDSKIFRAIPVSDDLLKYHSLQGKKILMTVRRLVPKNGPHYLIEALPKIIESIPDVHYVVVGDGPLRNKMEDRAKSLGVQDNVTFVGMIDNSKVVDYLSVAKVIVFPSTAESSSIACAEAMGMRKIIVASRVGGLVELLGKDQQRGYLVNLVPWTGSNYNAPEALPEASYVNLANGIIAAFTESSENEVKMNNALAYATNELSWDAIFNKTLSVYKKIVNI